MAKKRQRRVFQTLSGLPDREEFRLLVKDFLIVCDKLGAEPSFLSITDGMGRLILEDYFIKGIDLEVIGQKYGQGLEGLKSFLRVAVGEIVRFNSPEYFTRIPISSGARDFFFDYGFFTIMDFLMGLKNGSLKVALITIQRKVWAQCVLLYITLLWGNRLNLAV